MLLFIFPRVSLSYHRYNILSVAFIFIYRYISNIPCILSKIYGSLNHSRKFPTPLLPGVAGGVDGPQRTLGCDLGRAARGAGGAEMGGS